MKQVGANFPGLVVRMDKVHEFVVREAPERHAGEGRVLINFKRRDNAKRFDIVRIVTPKGRQAFAASIGHWGPSDEIKMDYDLRADLALSIGQTVELEITKCGLPGTVWWYLSVRDPHVRVPAWLGIISFGLGLLSLALAIPPLL